MLDPLCPKRTGFDKHLHFLKMFISFCPILNNICLHTTGKGNDLI